MIYPKEQVPTAPITRYPQQQGSSRSQIILPFGISCNPLMNISNIPPISTEQSYVYPKYPHGPILSESCQKHNIHQASYPNYQLPPNGFLSMPNQLPYCPTSTQDLKTGNPQKEIATKKCKISKKANETERESGSKPYYVRKCIGTKWTKEEVSCLYFH